MQFFKNLSSPTRRRAERGPDNDRGFLLNETAIWLVVIGLILGIGGYFGLQFITRTKSAAARQVLDNAVAVADTVYSQQFDGRTTFFGASLNQGKGLTNHATAAPVPDTRVTTSATTNANVKAVQDAWTLAGEGIKFVWWPSAATGTTETWHGALTAEPETIYFYINHADVTWDQDGTDGPPDTTDAAWNIPVGQMLIMGTADADGNTYCAVYVRQIVTHSAESAAEGFEYVGVGYQSKKPATPAMIAATNLYQDKYADCGMENLFRKTADGKLETTAADLNKLPDGKTHAELPGLPSTRSSLGDPE